MNPPLLKKKVLIVDDSAMVRHVMRSIVESDPELEVMAEAADPFEAADHIRACIPDVITLDIEMPKMDGITFLRKIMSQHPMPVVICSAFAEEGSDTVLQALEIGAVDIITKPRDASFRTLEEVRIQVCDVLKAAALSDPSHHSRSPEHSKTKKITGKILVPRPAPKLTADAILPPPNLRRPTQGTDMVIAIGASTGGTEALRDILLEMPTNSPGIAVVQHMPEHFTNSFAKRLNEVCALQVKEAADGDEVLRGRVLIAPGGFHMLVKRIGSRYFANIREGPLVSRHRPSVDVLFRSFARYAGANAVGVLLTGMGDDGARGLLEMRETGARTFAQDKNSCVVFGMPKEAGRMGAVEKFVPLNLIASELIALFRERL